MHSTIVALYAKAATVDLTQVCVCVCGVCVRAALSGGRERVCVRDYAVCERRVILSHT
jgi:hypothetical protein